MGLFADKMKQSYPEIPMESEGRLSKKELASSEKAMFLELLDKYRKGIVTQSTINHLLRAWIIRFQNDYLNSQYQFAPFPEELVPLPNSGKNRGID